MQRIRKRLIIVAIGMLAISCQHTASVEVVRYPFTLDLAAQSDEYVDRAFTFFAGPQADWVVMHLRLVQLMGDQRIEVMGATPAGGVQLILHIDEEGQSLVSGPSGSRIVTTRGVPGSVAVLRVVAPNAAVARPVIVVESLTIGRAGGIRLPHIGLSQDNVATIMPLTLNEPVEFAFDANHTTYLFSAVGLRGKNIDIAVDGPGRLRIADPVVNDFPINDANAFELWPRRASSATAFEGMAFARHMNSAKDTLVFAVTTDDVGGSGHSRITVSELVPPLRLSFPSNGHGAFFAGPIGMDWNPAPGTGLGIFASLDCTNFDGLSPAAGRGLVCYDGHPGTDFLLWGSFAAQPLDVPVTAAAAGTVIAIEDGHGDWCFADPSQPQGIRCMDSALPANYVVIRQRDGMFVYYYHIAMNSLQVRVGQRVACGNQLAAVGSSGISATPHIHFEPKSIRAVAFDPTQPIDSMLKSPKYEDIISLTTSVDPYSPNLWFSRTGLMPDIRCQ